MYKMYSDREESFIFYNGVGKKKFFFYFLLFFPLEALQKRKKIVLKECAFPYTTTNKSKSKQHTSFNWVRNFFFTAWLCACTYKRYKLTYIWSFFFFGRCNFKKEKHYSALNKKTFKKNNLIMCCKPLFLGQKYERMRFHFIHKPDKNQK